ncbi:heterokaryon incompatibility protein Het-C-domain-containing protein [Mariannaea sp. PMI_226]|nr:heterokaryon incompatibility protein Het-C-domain-containing protein [Mariannaea sp. PMI_226]
MSGFRSPGLLVGLVILVCLASPAFAFGAGNIASISKVEGQNWRHGDIEDALLTLTMARALNGKKFNKLQVSRVYFGNWLRDYSQAVDVGSVKYVSAEAVRLLLCVLGFMTFGYGSGEFEVTSERLGCYRPEEHIDNPKDYAENEDARRYDRRLRGPVDERRELSVDPETGMKNYIANERANIMTSAKLVKQLLSKSIQLGRRYRDRKNKPDKYEALRLMGTGLHCLEDFFAHSNYCELALIELGERDVFPHVGRNTAIQLQGARHPVFPIVTGTFGGVDFLHSVTGEVSDKLTQNEIDELEGTLQNSAQSDTSLLRDLLDKIPDGIIGGGNKGSKVDELQSNAAQAQMQNMSVSPREPEEFTRYIHTAFEQIMPAIQFHDDIMKNIDMAIEKIPVLPKIIEQLEEQLSVFIFSIIAPFVVPLINQIKNELKTGSAEIINSSEREQHVVFHNDNSTDPTHSMLAKDHFSNILNEIAGRCAASMVHWVVPQLMNAMDDDSVDIDELLDNIVHGIMHHPAQRDQGNRKVREGRTRSFDNVKEWWGELGQRGQQEYRRKLTRDGVQNGENHREGVHDTGHGHGCAGKLKMRKMYGGPETVEDKIANAAAGAILGGATSAFSGMIEQNTGYKLPNQSSHQQEEEGGLGGFLGAASSLLGGAFGDNSRKETSSRQESDGSYTRTQREYGHDGNSYGQAQYSQTQRYDGSQQSQYQRYEQHESSDNRRTESYSYEQRTETQSYGSGGYGEGRHEERHEKHGSGRHHKRDDDSDGDDNRRRSHSKERRHNRKKSNDSDNDDNRRSGHGGHQGGYSGGYGGRDESSRQEYGGGYGGREESSRQEYGGYGGRSESSRQDYGGSYGGGSNENRSYGGGYDSNRGYGGGSDENRSYGGGYNDNSGYGGSNENRSYGNEYGGRQEGGYGGSANEYTQQGGYGGEYGERNEYENRENRNQYGGGSGYGGDRRW